MKLCNFELEFLGIMEGLKTGSLLKREANWLCFFQCSRTMIILSITSKREPIQNWFWYVVINSSNACSHMVLQDFASKSDNTRIAVNIENEFYYNCEGISCS